MGIVKINLTEDLMVIVDRQVADGRAASQEEFVAAALRRYAEHLDVEDEIAAMAQRADADVAAGRFVTVATAEDSEALHQAAVSRLRVRLNEDAAKS